jgi:putative ABC transport system permease protein
VIDDLLESTPRRGMPSGGEERSSARRPDWRQRLRKPAILDLRPGPLVSIYAWRLRRHGLQELLAGVGIAIGVALMFGVLTAGQSITGSAGGILRAITGKATLQVSARSPEGFSESLVERMGKLPAVAVAAPLLRTDAVVSGPEGTHPIQLVGATASQLDLEGRATRYLGSEHLGDGIALSSSLAREIGATLQDRVTVLARGRAVPLPVHAVWASGQIGPVADAAIAVAPLSVVQATLALPHRVTQVFIVPAPHQGAQATAQLKRIASGRLNVQPAHHELVVLDATAKPSTESSRLFAAIGAIVGVLFAVNAMLLTVPERRRWVAEARIGGYSATQVVLILGFQALVLGIVASAAGLLLGYVLAETLFGGLPEFLTLSFPIGNKPIITAPTIALSLGAGVLATLVASAAPLRDLSSRQPIDAVFRGDGKVGHAIGSGTVGISAMVSAAVILGGLLLALLAPSLSIVGIALLALGALSAVPALLVVAVRGLMPIAERLRRSMLAIALSEVQGTATRSIALTTVAALAVFGSVAVIGAREDLIGGLNEATVQLLNTADVWVTPVGNNPFLTDSFTAQPAAAAIQRVPGVLSVRRYQGSFLDVGQQRMWIRARPMGDRAMVQASQLVQGDLARAEELLRGRGWAAVSSGFAAERHLRLADAFSLPTPSGEASLRVAAITTNSGWPPGAITINQPEYEHLWQTGSPSALEVNTRPGVAPQAVRQAIASALSSYGGLRAQTLSEREAQHRRDERRGVENLSEISQLVLIAGALAIAFALGAAIAARRSDLAARKAEGYETSQLWRVLGLEGAVVLGVGSLTGVALGIGAHALASRWLRLSRGFPAPFGVHAPQLLVTLAIVAGVAAAVLALGGYLVARVSPRLDTGD